MRRRSMPDWIRSFLWDKFIKGWVSVKYLDFIFHDEAIPKDASLVNARMHILIYDFVFGTGNQMYFLDRNKHFMNPV
jgi:hypothetical protein